MENTKTTKVNIDLEKIKKMHEEDPEACMDYCKQLTQDYILERYGHDPVELKRMQGLQFKIDTRVNKFKSPIKRMAEMEIMLFEDGVYPLQEAIMDPAIRGQIKIDKELKSNNVVSVDFGKRNGNKTDEETS